MNSPKSSQSAVEAEAGLLLELAVGAGEVVLALVEVPAHEPPLLRVDHRELVALLEQHPAAVVDEDDAREPLHAARYRRGFETALRAFLNHDSSQASDVAAAAEGLLDQADGAADAEQPGLLELEGLDGGVDHLE